MAEIDRVERSLVERPARARTSGAVLRREGTIFVGAPTPACRGVYEAAAEAVKQTRCFGNRSGTI